MPNWTDYSIPLPPRETTGIGYALPILVFVIVLLSFIFYIRLIRKGHLTLSDTFVWILFTLLMITVSLYLLILQILWTFGISGFNLFAWLASELGFSNSPGWLTFVILVLIIFLYSKSFYTTVKLVRLKETINSLAREVAIMNGKLSKTLEQDKKENKEDEKEKKNDN